MDKIEEIARAIYDECRILEQNEHGGDIQSPWGTLNEKQREQMMRVARAAYEVMARSDGEVVKRVASILKRQRDNRYAEEAIANDDLIDECDDREIIKTILKGGEYVR